MTSMMLLLLMRKGSKLLQPEFFKTQISVEPLIKVTRIRYLISYHHTPQKLRQIKNNLKKKIYDNFNESSKKQAFEAEQYFNPPVILLGNKSDLGGKRQVPRKTAKAKGKIQNTQKRADNLLKSKL